MAKLPDASDIGRRIPQVAGGVASADTTQVARAMQGLGQAITSTAGEIGERQDKFNYAEAQSDFLKKKLDIMSSFDADNDYSTFCDRYTQKINKAREESAGLIRNNDDRRAFEIDTNNDIFRGADQIKTLARRKEVDHGVASLNATIQSNRDAALSAKDEATRQGFISATRNAIDGAFERGYIDDTQRQTISQRSATDYATASIGMMQPDQRIPVLQSGTGMAKYLPPDTRKKLLDASAAEVIGNRISQAQVSLMNQQGITGYAIGPIPEEDLFNAVVWQESGGRQLASDGSPLTSPKGAVGISQVMPGTAPEAAQLAGLPWDEQRYKNDASYNHALGKAYLKQQLKKYGGNSVLALAAYNAGPGKVDEWIKQIGDPRKGEVSNEGFANSIPYGETQNYVARIMSNAAKINVTKDVVQSPEFQLLDPQQKARAVEQTYNVIDTATSNQRFNIQQRMDDDISRINSGEPVNTPVNASEYIAAQELNSTPAQRAQAAQRFEQYRQILSLQPAYQAIISSPETVGLAMVNSLKPEADESDFEFKQKRYTMAAQKYQQTISARENDPGGWMVQNIPQVKQAFESYNENPDLMGDYIKTVQMQKQRLGIKNQAVLPTAQANQLSQSLITAPAEQKAAILDAIHKGTGGGASYMATMSQIAPKAPSAAVAGVLMDKASSLTTESNMFSPDIKVTPSEAATTILQGASARNGSGGAKGIPMPKDTEMRNGFADVVGNAFAGDADGAETAYQAAQDYYAGVMQSKGDLSGQFDNATWKQAVNVATGGVYDYNGQGNVLMPWGMSTEQFDRQVNQAWESQVNRAGIKAPPGQYGLQSYGDSQYLVKLGAGYLVKNDGTPVIINLQQSRQRFTGGIPQ
ncbi:transglycosylase SLT domain-containing protein [Raoultella terrigena]|uniref:transglycosylase SLT domain-containing protein n=1 Tax=Raoultella terrigena TaxID=577 RepID=UPI00384B68E2